MVRGCSGQRRRNISLVTLKVRGSGSVTSHNVMHIQCAFPVPTQIALLFGVVVELSSECVLQKKSSTETKFNDDNHT